MRRRTLVGAALAALTPGWPVLAQPGPLGSPGGRGVAAYGPAGSAGLGPGAMPGPSLDLRFLTGALDPRITYTGGNGSYFNSAGAITAATTNVARFDADPVTLAPRGLLIEEARTNLLLNSATLGTQTVTVTAAATTLSFYGTGTVTLTGTFAGSLVGSGAFPTRSTLTFTPTAGALVCTVTGSVLNAQIETGAFATSWIPTVGSTVTRAADVATMPVGTWFNAAAGAIASEYLIPAGSSANNSHWELDDGTSSNQLTNYQNAGGSPLAVFNRVGGTIVANYTSGSSAIGVIGKDAVAWSAAGTVATANGAAPITNAAVVGIFNRLVLGDGGGGAGLSQPLDGWLRRIRVWPRALGVVELQGATV